MCGIAGIITRDANAFSLEKAIFHMGDKLSHRGPDGEGFLFASSSQAIPFVRSFKEFSKKELAYAPQKNNPVHFSPSLAFLHRRLSILDLSENGHQPMCTADKKLWITFNGEIYNYIELKKQLSADGFSFVSETDTEVILYAYIKWGQACVQHFNGMWAFAIYDTEKQIVFSSRDRFGVKPFYYCATSNYFAFASEQKALFFQGAAKAEADPLAIHDYLVNEKLEAGKNNFFKNVEELLPGHNLQYSVTDHTIKTQEYYRLSINNTHNDLTDQQLIYKIEELLFNAVKLRLRSDVEVGACLSGGIDSSVLVALMAKAGNAPHCFTSIFTGQKFNEEKFAREMAGHIAAQHSVTEPDLIGFLNELDTLIYSQDVPIWDTSTYAQFKVMELAATNNIKVVVDGQGADELFGGYHHHFIARWNQLISEGQIGATIKDIRSSQKTIASPFAFFVKEKVKNKMHLGKTALNKMLDADFINMATVENKALYFDTVNEQLKYDIEKARLKPFLKCEDRCGMWHSVESRTPFSDDVDLIEFMFSFNGSRKIKNGVSKYLLREASKTLLPDSIYKRYDKKGFETPMRKWVEKSTRLMKEEISIANFPFLKKDALDRLTTANQKELKLFFRLFILNRWKRIFEA